VITKSKLMPCDICDDLLDGDVYVEEQGMCLPCSDLFWSHDHPDCSWACMANIGEYIRTERGLK
jgi:hypothetical protein